MSFNTIFSLVICLSDQEPGFQIPLHDSPPDEPEEPPEEMVAVGEHPKYAKFFKMMKVGLPKDAIKAKMTQEGVDPTYLDKEPTEMVPLNPKPKGSAKSKLQDAAKAVVSKVRKKKIYWKALDASKMSANSLWSTGGCIMIFELKMSCVIGTSPVLPSVMFFNFNILSGADDANDILLDEAEFNALFVDSGETKEKEVVVVAKEPKKQKVNIINMKRAQNAGIALARVRFKYEGEIH